MKIIEIFKSIEGEGVRTGKLSTFVRVAGCNLRCSYCDTKYSYEGGEEMTVEQILKKIEELDCTRITITGGEPLIHEDMRVLLIKLSRAGYDVNVETNGSMWVRDFWQDGVMFTIDWKCYSSGESGHMKQRNLQDARACDCIKFVVGSKIDLDEMKKMLPWINKECQNIYVSPVLGRITAKQIVEYLKEHNLERCTLQLQIHKIIWPADKRGV